ncbi:hypothetical protein M404DRAFT_36406, partial [Pisolithus tinctorius Marx 270]
MSIRRSRTPYDQELPLDLTRATSEELRVGSDDDDEAIRGKLAERKRRKAKAQEEARLAEEARLEAERQEQARLEEERARAEAEAEAQRLEAARKAEEARKEAESRRADALVGSSAGTGPNVEVMSPRCLRCARTNMPCLRSTDSKKKRMACNRCNELKERCRWPVEGEAGAGPVGDKGKRKADVTSPRAGEKKKRSRRPSAKVTEGAGDEEDDVEEGPSTKKTGAETGTGPVTGDQMERLIKAVERVADNMAGLATAQKEVSRNFYRFARSYETYVEERFEFLAPEVPSDRDTTDEEDRE